MESGERCKLPQRPQTYFSAFSGHQMHLVTTDLPGCYAVQMIKLKQILLHKRWQLIFFILEQKK